MRICVGICGSIAAYRSVDFIKELKNAGFELQCVLSRSAEEFVSSRVLETFSGRRVLTSDIFDPSHFSTDHIETARWAEAFVIYGATANFIARLAHGLADDFLNLQLLAFSGKVFIAPAMNPSMWQHAAVQENVKKLKERGCIFIGPISGKVACGETGIGHLAEHSSILEVLRSEQKSNTPDSFLKGKSILISAGPMRCLVDSVRYIQNRSSGKMGLELAKACKKAGASEINILLGPVSSEIRQEFTQNFDVSFYEGPASYEATLERLFPECDVFFSAAAVLDFELSASPKKIERTELARAQELKIPLKTVDDIVAKFAAKKSSHQKVIAFAAETGNETEIIERATLKMKKKGVDALIANPVWENLGPESDSNQVWILRPSQEPKALGPALKSELSTPILRELWTQDMSMR